MVEPVSASVIGGLALRKLFGPAVGEVGEALRRWTEYRLRNVGRVAENARSKLDDPDEPGTINGRVAMFILEQGSWSDDEIVNDYLGGVLAASKTSSGGDDAGTMWAALIARLPSSHLRSHYLLYRSMRDALVGHEINLGDGNVAQAQAKMFMPFDAWATGMEISDQQRAWELFDESIWSLHSENLIGTEFRFGPDIGPLDDAAGLSWVPSVQGCRLFLWAHGRRSRHPNQLLDPELQLRFGAELPPTLGAADMRSLFAELNKRREAEQSAIEPEPSAPEVESLSQADGDK